MAKKELWRYQLADELRKGNMSEVEALYVGFVLENTQEGDLRNSLLGKLSEQFPFLKSYQTTYATD